MLGTLGVTTRWGGAADVRSDGSCELFHAGGSWSQDAWALPVSGEYAIPTALIEQANFALGLPGCDNRIAALLGDPHGR
jgi:hypothetical protein